jgi:hypothetical protein
MSELPVHLVQRECWERGEIARILLDAGQRQWVAGLDALPPASWAAWKVARQRGKTFAALVWLMQRMGLDPSLSAVYLAQTGGNAQAIVQQFAREIGPGLPPEWGVSLKEGVLQTIQGAELSVFGTDNQQYRRRRGRKARVVLLDESAFFADLLDVEQVYVPQLQTTGGVGLYLSSPPISPAHPFNDRCRSAQASGRYVHDTFWSNPRINHEAVIKGECERLGLSREELLASTAFRREFLAEDVTEESRAAVPAWTPEAHAALVGDWQRPPHFDAYVSADWSGGAGDPTFALFAWFDFPTQTLTIEEELELRGTSTVAQCADAVKAVEARLWGASRWDGTLLGAGEWVTSLKRDAPSWVQAAISAAAPRQPYLRVGDDDAMLLRELAGVGLAFVPTRKDDKHLAIDALNTAFAQRKIRIHSRCKRTIEQLYTSVWNRQRTEWERNDKDHADAIDALGYLFRNVNIHRDARPVPYGPDGLPVKRTSGWNTLTA